MKYLNIRIIKMRKPAKLLRLSLLAVCLLLLLGTAVLKLTHEHNKALASGTPSSSTPCVSNPAPTQWRHVVVVMFENKYWGDVVGNPSAPYITNLVSKCGTAYSGTAGATPKQNWHDANYKVNGTQDGTYNSKPNYATLTSGVSPTTHGLRDDTYSTTTNVDNIYKELNTAGKTAKDYYDGPASSTPCASSNFVGAYHDAIRYFTPSIGSAYCNSHDVPVSTFMNDVNSGNLPAWSMILPTNCENMHSCNSTSTDWIAAGDNWARNFLNPLFDSAQYRSGDTAVFFLWDENTAIPNVLIAPSVVPGSRVPAPAGNPISHFSATKTWAEMLGIPYLGDSGQAPSLLSCFNGNCGSVPPPPQDNPPSVNLTAPTNGATLTTSPVTVSANATDDNGVTKVEFYDASTLIGTDTSAPYSISWNINSLSGSHTLTAKAYDTGGHNTTSNSSTVTISPTTTCPTLPTAYGTATDVVNVASNGTYHVWTRVMAPDTTNNSLYLKADADCAVLMGDSSNIPANTWTWIDYKNADVNSHVTDNLAAGNHTFTMIGNEPGVKLDRVLLLSDSCVPTGKGDNCTDTTAPTVSVTAPTSGSTVNGTVTLSANASDNGGSGVASVKFYIDGSLVGTSTTSPYQFSWNSRGVADGTHSVRADAMDISGNVGTSSTVSFTVHNADVTPPSTPTNLVVTRNTYNEVDISWTASTDNVGVTSYKIYRNAVLVSDTAQTTFSDRTVSPNTAYTYTVAALDAAGNASSQSTGLTVTTPTSPDTQPPTTPGNLVATVRSATQVDLSWTASTDNVSVTQYYIQRNGVVIAGVNATSYSDTSAQPSTTYTYTVYAVDAANNRSPASNLQTVTTPARPDTTPPTAPTSLTGTAVAGQVDLSWNASTDNVAVAGYKIYRNGTMIATTTVTNFGDATVASGQSYTYYVVAFDASNNNSAASNQVTVTVSSTPTPTTLNFNPTDDSTLRKKYPNTNYGTENQMAFATIPAKRGIMKFKVSGINGRLVTSAILQLKVSDSSDYGGNFQALVSNSWNEKTVTWNNAPKNTGVNLASRGAITQGKFVTIDLSNYITKDGTYSLEIISKSTDVGKYYSKEAPNSKPLLSVTIR